MIFNNACHGRRFSGAAIIFETRQVEYRSAGKLEWRQFGGEIQRPIPELPITCGNGLINVKVCITSESSVVGQAIDDC